MNNKEKQAQHEQEVMGRVIDSLSSSGSDCYFGFTKEDMSELIEVFEELEQNQETTYPDFMGPHGCVELLEISSSPEIRNKGPEQKKQDGELAKKIRHEDEEAAKAGDMSPRQYCRKRSMHSYKALTRHLRKQFEKHVRSMHKSEREHAATVFVIELRESDLECMIVPVETIPAEEKSLAEGLSVGDLWPSYSKGKVTGRYRLSRDKDNLQWLAQKDEGVHYVIFVGPAGIEAINLRRVDALAPFFPRQFIACGKAGITVVRSTPINFQMEVSDEQR